eukprot:765393-Hanusia_phi.AAC.2
MQAVTAAQEHLRSLHGRLRELIAKGGDLRDQQRACSKEFDAIDDLQNSELQQLAENEVLCIILDHDSSMQTRRHEVLASELKHLERINIEISSEDAKRRAEFGNLKDSIIALPDSYYTHKLSDAKKELFEIECQLNEAEGLKKVHSQINSRVGVLLSENSDLAASLCNVENEIKSFENIIKKEEAKLDWLTFDRNESIQG